jgi:hypothetical protein
MKSFFTTLILMLATLATQAQLLTPEMVVNRMPVITITVCKKEVREQFLKHPPEK